MPTRSKAAVLVEPNTPLVIDEVIFPDPAPDQVLVNDAVAALSAGHIHGRSIIMYE